MVAEGASTAPPKESVFGNLDRLLHKSIKVKFTGGREVVGTLRGSDQIGNLVLESTTEYMRSSDDTTQEVMTRKLGLCVAKGSSVQVVAPLDGSEEVSNPYVGGSVPVF
eukprot:Trichotokara_eunicae@DN1753_c0_g1_i2.p1